MKKVLLSVLVLAMCFSFAFAADKQTIHTYGDIDFTFQPTFSRYNAMGQSGLAAAGRMDSFYTNPAALAEERFGLSLPTVAVTLFNVQKLVSDPEAMTIVNSMIDGTADDNAAANLAEKMIKNLGSGYNTLATIDAGVGAAFGSFGLGANVQVKLHTLAKGSSNVANVKVVPEVNVAQTVALGLNIIKTDALKLQIGAAGHFVYKAYLQGQDAATVSSLLSDDDGNDVQKKLLWNTPTMGGYAIPVDLGVTLSLANDAVRLSATANNLNGTYRMSSYDSFANMTNSVVGTEVFTPEEGYEAKESEKFEIKTPWTLNFGFAFAPNVIFKPVITADLIDMLGMVKSLGSDSFKAEDLLLHLNAGAEVSILCFNLRAGVNRGYMSVGAGVGILGMRIDATYGWQEFGAELGDKPVDSFTIRFNLGYDK